MACTRRLMYTSLKPKFVLYKGMSEKPYKLSLVYRKTMAEINNGKLFGMSDIVFTDEYTACVTKEDGLKVFERLNKGECFECGDVSKCSMN